MLNLENVKSTESSFLKLIDIIPDAIVIVNKEGKIKYINSKTEKLFGYTNSELIDQEVEILIPMKFRQRHVKHRETYSKEPLTRPMGSGLDLLARRKDGSELPVDIMLSKIETDSEPLVISVIRDITDLRQREVESKRKARQLEDLVSTFIHDLKTPLIAANTSYKHLYEGYFGNLTNDQKQILNLLIQSNSGLLRLVNNLLFVFKYESKSYKLLLEAVSINALLESSINTVKPIIEENKIDLKVSSTNFQFICDPFEIERVIINLLTNSIKFIPGNGKIEIKAIKNENGETVIYVEDNGKGIRKEELPNIFERFWQSKKSDSSSNSTGLGLYLCRQIIEAHGGKIWAESSIGRGTKVTFEIPDLTL